jgi:hypothetical protein
VGFLRLRVRLHGIAVVAVGTAVVAVAVAVAVTMAVVVAVPSHRRPAASARPRVASRDTTEPPCQARELLQLRLAGPRWSATGRRPLS